MHFQESNLSGRLLGDRTPRGPTCSRFRASWERILPLPNGTEARKDISELWAHASGWAFREARHGAGEEQRFAKDGWEVRPRGAAEGGERFPRTPQKLNRGRTAELRAAHQWPHVHETGAAAGARGVRVTCAALSHLLSSSGDKSHRITHRLHIHHAVGFVLAFSPSHCHKPPGTGDGHGCVTVPQ